MIEHIIERNGLFTIIVLGEPLIAIVLVDRFAIQVVGLLISMSLFSIYFDMEPKHGHANVHAIRRHWFAALVWTYAHLPFHASIALIGAGLERSEDDLYARYLICGGVAVALAAVSLIGGTHKREATTRINFRMRRSFRVGVAIVVPFLPFAGASRDTCALIVSVLLVVIALLDAFGAKIIEVREDRREREQRFDPSLSLGLASDAQHLHQRTLALAVRELDRDRLMVSSDDLGDIGRIANIVSSAGARGVNASARAADTSRRVTRSLRRSRAASGRDTDRQKKADESNGE